MGVVAALIAGVLANIWVRPPYYRYKLRRALAGEDVRVWTRMHQAGAPDWRYLRGSVVRSAGWVYWRPVVRRWRKVDMSQATITGASLRSSVANGDRFLMTLSSAPPFDHVAVNPALAPVLESILLP